MLRTLALVTLAAATAASLAGCSAPRPGVEPAATPVDADVLMEEVAYGSWGVTKLHPDFLFVRLRDRAGTPAVAAAFDRLLADDTPAARDALLRGLERGFVHAETTSALDLLGPHLGERFRGFDWQAADYPGGEEGPNEAYAETLADALDAVTPERRANRSDIAVIQRAEATEEIWGFMLAQWRPVPGEDGHKLNRHAVDAYVAMREAAAADGVKLEILSAHRDPERSRSMAANAGNSFAVASFSSHSLGLAIDFLLPEPGEDAGDFRLSTRPMSAVVDMRRSPVHKWLHLHGREHGWYPYQQEPWHWEYNPVGFREVFFADFAGGTPERVTAAE